MKQNNMDDELNKSIDSKENNDTITPFPHWIQFKSKNEITDRKLIILGDYFLTCFIISDIFYKEFKSDTRESDVSMIKINSKYLEDIKKNIFEKFREHLQIVSVIKNGIEIDIELDKLDTKSLKGSLEDMTANIKKIESEIKDLENRLYK